MGGPVVAGHPGAVEAEKHRLMVQPDVEVHLVDRPGEEGRIHGEHRPETHHRHAGSGGDRMLFGDADVEDAVGKALHHRQQPGRVGHRGGKRHQFGPGFGLGDDRLGKGAGVAARLDRAHVVEVLDRVVLGWGVSPSLLGEHVDDDRAVHLLGRSERPLEGIDVVAIERPEVGHAEVLEERRRLEHVAEGVGGRVPSPPEHLAARQVAHHTLDPGGVAPVHRVGAKLDQAVAQAGGGRGVGAAVVVEDGDDPAAAVAQVVQPLEGHPPGHRPVADDGDDVPLGAAAQLERGRHALGIGQHG